MTSPVESSFVHSMQRLIREHFPRLYAHRVNSETHLLFDLGLDSVELMQVLVLLENKYHYTIPDSALSQQALDTVADLERMVTGEAAPTVGEPELDVKVHCVVSCLCHPVKEAAIDHRPMYFGVWDAPVFIDDQHRLRYHTAEVNHDDFFAWFSRLYGARVHSWYDPHVSKRKNIERLERLLAEGRSSEHLMVMLDLYRLPERENRFRINPFPHYVLLEETDRVDRLWMWDPDFRWEGALDRRRILHAVESPAVAGGYRLNVSALRTPRPADVAAYFEACFQPHGNGLTDAVQQVVSAYTSDASLHPRDLGAALSELPVLGIRKYAYEHGFAYFWRALERPEPEFEHWCESIEQLANGYDRLLFVASQFSEAPGADGLNALWAEIATQNARECRIKQALSEAYRAWRAPVSSSSNPYPRSETVKEATS